MPKTVESQIETSPRIEELSAKIIGKGKEFLENARKVTLQSLTRRDYTEANKSHEALIRWRRTADQILQDGYVYAGKSCTDLVVVFIAICRAKGHETRFVKLKREKNGKKIVHSVAEVKLEDGWYTVDVSGNGGIVKGEILQNKTFNEYLLWKKGRDAWDLGLTDFESIKNIQ